jgi:hypothetical protein
MMYLGITLSLRGWRRIATTGHHVARKDVVLLGTVAEQLDEAIPTICQSI